MDIFSQQKKKKRFDIQKYQEVKKSALAIQG